MAVPVCCNLKQLACSTFKRGLPRDHFFKVLRKESSTAQEQEPFHQPLKQRRAESKPYVELAKAIKVLDRRYVTVTDHWQVLSQFKFKAFGESIFIESSPIKRHTTRFIRRCRAEVDLNLNPPTCQCHGAASGTSLSEALAGLLVVASGHSI
jgi:hypothetical protein